MNNLGYWNSVVSMKKNNNPIWKLKVVIILLAMLGIIDTSLLLYNHFFSQGECQILPWGLNILGNDCGIVTNSAYSRIAQFPLAIWGLIGYFLILSFTTLSLIAQPYFWTTTLLAGLGAGISWILTGIQHFSIEAYCPLCILSAIIMLFIFITAMVGVIIYAPPFLNKNQIMTTLLLGSLIMVGGLLAYKVLEDYTPPVDETRTSTYLLNQESNTNKFPAGIIDEEIIYLRSIDEILQKNLSPQQWQILTGDPQRYDQTWQEFRRRSLYLIAIDHWAQTEKKEKSSIIVESLGSDSKVTWDNFIPFFFPMAAILDLSQGQKPSAATLTPSIEQQLIIDFLKKNIAISENIPPTELFNP